MTTKKLALTENWNIFSSCSLVILKNVYCQCFAAGFAKSLRECHIIVAITNFIRLGVIHKVCTLRFRNFRPPRPMDVYITYNFSLKPPLQLLVRACEHYFLEKIWQRYILWITINQRTTNVQRYRKISNHNTTTIPGIEFVLFNCTGEDGNGWFWLSEKLTLYYFYS